MSKSESWPTNKYGTTWRSGRMYFDWQDEPLVSEALDVIDSTKISIRFPCSPAAAIGFDTIAEMIIFRFADILPYGDHWDQERLCIVVDPCSDPETLQALVEEKIDTVQFSVFGVAALDLADEGNLRRAIGRLEGVSRSVCR